MSNRKEYGNGQSVKTVGRQWWPEERQGKYCKGAQKIHLKVKVGVGKKMKVERGRKPENNHLWWGQWPTWGIIHTEGNVTEIRRKLSGAQKIQMIFAHQVVAAHCQHEPAIENILNITWNYNKGHRNDGVHINSKVSKKSRKNLVFCQNRGLLVVVLTYYCYYWLAPFWYPSCDRNL